MKNTPKKYLRFVFALVLIASSLFTNAQINVYLGKQSVVPPDWFGYNGANVVRKTNPAYDTQWMIDSLSNLGATVVRYPAGTVGNYWDWQSGCFLSSLPYNLVMPKDFSDSGFNILDLNSLKMLTDRNSITPIFNLNILSSDKYYQSAGLMFANAINLPVKYVELGNEIYLDDRAYVNRFPTPESYIQEANSWATYIKSKPGFSNYKVAVAGATDRYPAEPAVSRRNRWNALIAANANSSVDAITLHWYISTSGNYAINEQTAPTVLSTPFTAYKALGQELKDISGAGKEAWFTEYNLFDRGHCLHQHFIHGLFTSAMTLTLLQNPVITHIDCHSIVGTSEKASIFSDSTGFDLKGFTNDGINCTPYPIPATRARELTSQGVCMSLVGRALQNAKTKRQLNFTNSPKLPGGFDALFGFYFDGTVSTEMVILNLDSVNRSITIDSATWNLSQGKYISVYPGPGGVLDLIKGNAKTIPGQMECTTTGYLQASQTMTLKAYSVTRIFVKKDVVKVKVTDNTVCSGTNTTLMVQGEAGYTWSDPNLVPVKSDNSVMRFNAPVVTAPATYTITVTSSFGHKDSTTITVYPKPVLTVSSDLSHVCKGGEVRLHAALTGANSANTASFIWTPTTGNGTPDRDSIIANPVDNTIFRCYATDGRCWASYDSVYVRVIPKADAGPDYSLCDDSLPYTLHALQVDPLLHYKWYQNGTLIGSGTSVNVSPVMPATYTLIVSTDSVGGCVDSDDVKITPYICCPSADYPGSLTFKPGEDLKSVLIPRIKSFCMSNPGHGYCTSDTLKDFHDEIMFNGNFIANCNFTFINCDKLRFGEKAMVKVTGNGTNVKFVNCSLNMESCSGRMWGGVYMDNFNSMLTIDKCVISNAEKVVEGTNDPRINVTNTKFDKCYMGIYLHDNEEVQEGDFYGDTMSFSGSLKYPHSGEKPLCAFKLDNNPQVQIGDSNYAGNYWNNIQYGFIAYNSDIIAYNNKFENITRFGTSDTLNGTAIYMKDPFGYGNVNDPTQLWPEFHLTYGAENTTTPNTMLNCDNGIYVENGDAVINGSVFTNTKKAIRLTGCMLKKIELRSNTITGADVGIDLIEPKLSNVNIFYNNVTTKNQSGGTNATPAIRIADVNGENSIPVFKTNIIHSGGTHGLWIQNNHKVVLADMKIYLDNPNATFPSYGLKVENVDSLKVKCNLTRGNDASSTANKTNMSFAFCPAGSLDCNTIDFAATGIEFLANCNNTSVKNTDFKYLDDGLVVGAIGQTGGVVGPQPTSVAGRPNNNKFIGQYTEVTSGPGKYKGHFGHAATYAINSQCGGTRGTTQQFYVYKADSMNIPYPNLASGVDAAAFIPYYQIKAGNPCNVNCIQPNPNRVGDPSIPQGDKDDESYDAASDQSRNYDYTLRSVIPLLGDDATLWSVKSDLYFTLKSNPSEMINKPALQQFYNEIQNSNIHRIGELQKGIDAMNIPAQGTERFAKKLAVLSQMNDAIIPSNEIEKSVKLYNSIYFKSLQNNSLEADDLMTLKQLSNSCPYMAGVAVFKARALYSRYNPYANYNDAELCRGKYSSDELHHTSKNFEDVSFNVYPNPGNGSFTVNYNLSRFSDAMVIFYDVTGKQVQLSQIDITRDRANLNLHGVNNGVYYYTVYGDGKAVNHGKIIVIE